MRADLQALVLDAAAVEEKLAQSNIKLIANRTLLQKLRNAVTERIITRRPCNGWMECEITLLRIYLLNR